MCQECVNKPSQGVSQDDRFEEFDSKCARPACPQYGTGAWCVLCRGNGDEVGGDPDWIAAHEDLLELHIDKSSTYGQDSDRFHNFTALAELVDEDAERYVLERILEKLIRSLNMLKAGDGQFVKEYPDIASLALCAEALRRKRCSEPSLG